MCFLQSLAGKELPQTRAWTFIRMSHFGVKKAWPAASVARLSACTAVVLLVLWRFVTTPTTSNKSLAQHIDKNPTGCGQHFTRMEPKDQGESQSTIPPRKVVLVSREHECHTPSDQVNRQRRRQQNDAAQVRHRNKRDRFLHETLRSIDSLKEELKQTKTQRDYFRLMYENLETQLLEIRRQASL